MKDFLVFILSISVIIILAACGYAELAMILFIFEPFLLFLFFKITDKKK